VSNSRHHAMCQTTLTIWPICKPTSRMLLLFWNVLYRSAKSRVVLDRQIRGSTAWKPSVSLAVLNELCSISEVVTLRPTLWLAHNWMQSNRLQLSINKTELLWSPFFSGPVDSISCCCLHHACRIGTGTCHHSVNDGA